eukprot:CAMPEP_0176392586 /NCGR_PEP_ID=MMETSP0126-20121128/40991_1 /TAXON_ID=141414 ORGANISM="Strombidinopsis acuminatum, Strain SPMC142" /NCGR_SAMPLE_ID=MMETSP0126 /ASSEMBLY_ACC=CAM_ASM_000229 /LENGTH=89 /DNA_ID=CAMNT_0017763481 /DNA_START=1582 /DNA_END=1851 /DNA_ORIENTATION=+
MISLSYNFGLATLFSEFDEKEMIIAIKPCKKYKGEHNMEFTLEDLSLPDDPQTATFELKITIEFEESDEDEDSGDEFSDSDSLNNSYAF